MEVARRDTEVFTGLDFAKSGGPPFRQNLPESLYMWGLLDFSSIFCCPVSNYPQMPKPTIDRVNMVADE